MLQLTPSLGKVCNTGLPKNPGAAQPGTASQLAPHPRGGAGGLRTQDQAKTKQRCSSPAPVTVTRVIFPMKVAYPSKKGTSPWSNSLGNQIKFPHVFPEVMGIRFRLKNLEHANGFTSPPLYFDERVLLSISDLATSWSVQET